MLVERNGGHAFVVCDAVRAHVLPSSLPVLRDIDGDGRPDVRAETPIRHLDANNNGVLDHGEVVELDKPRIFPLKTDAPLVWTTADTRAVHEQVRDTFC